MPNGKPVRQRHPGEVLLAGVSSGASCPSVLHSVLAGLRRTEPFGSDPEFSSDDSVPTLDLVVTSSPWNPPRDHAMRRRCCSRR